MVIITSFIKNSDIKVVLILFILSCIFFWKVLLNPSKIIFAEYFSDTISEFLPYKTLIHDTWKNTGNLPLWNPYTFMGNPVVGNVLYAMFHPYNLFYLTSLEPATLFGFLFILDIFLIGVFTYFFVRSIDASRFGALVAAVTFMFSGVMIARIYGGHPINLDIITMVPLSFLVIEIAIQRRSLFYGALTGVPIALQLVGGNIQVALYAIAALGLYFILRSLFIIRKNRKDTTKLISIIILAGLVGISLSAVQLIPSFELSEHASRFTINYESSTLYSFSPEQSLTFLMPEFFGTFLDYTYWGARNFWELCVYTGVFSIVLTIIAFFGVKNEHKTIFFLLLAFSFLFALGRYFPIYAIFYRFVPFFDMFRKPSAMLFLTAFSLSVLSAFGADIFAKTLNIKLRKRFSFLIKLLMVLALLTLVVVLSTYAFKETIMSMGKSMLVKRYEHFTAQVHTLPYELDFYINKIPDVYSHISTGLVVFLATLSVITTILHLRVRKKIQIRQFQIVVVVIILFDLWLFGMKYIDVIDTETILAKRPVIEFLENETEKFRVLDMSDTLPQYVAMKYNIEILGEYEPVQMKNYIDFMNFHFGGDEETEIGYGFLNIKEDRVLVNSKLLGLLNTKYILTNAPVNNSDFSLRENITTVVYVRSLSNVQYKSNRRGYLPSNLTTQVYVYENKNLLPRAFVVRNARIVDSEVVLSEIAAKEFNPKETIILDRDPGIPLSNLGTYKQADIVSYSPNEIEIQVDIDEPGFLVLSENYYPGWKAIDNGEETEIYRADYILRSIYLEAGKHEVKFIYNPPSFRLGLSITIIATLSLCVLMLHRIKSNLQGAK